MSISIIYIFLFLGSVLVSSISQIILKKSANEKHADIVNEYLNKKVMFAYSLFFISSLLTIFAYRNIPLSFGPILEATGYIYIAVFGYIFLKEKLTIKQLVGMLFIFIGVITYAVF